MGQVFFLCILIPAGRRQAKRGMGSHLHAALKPAERSGRGGDLIFKSHIMKVPMAKKNERRSWVMVNRAPVLTLWAAVVAEVLGFEHDEALTLRRAVAGLNAYSKGFR